MVRPAPIPRRSSHLGSAACPGRSDHGSHSSTSAASSRSKRRQGNHNRFPTLKMFPDGHSDVINVDHMMDVVTFQDNLLLRYTGLIARGVQRVERSPEICIHGLVAVVQR